MDEVEDQDGGLDLAWTSACSRTTTTKTMASSLNESCLRPAARERAERARALVTAIYSRDRRRFRRPRNRGPTLFRRCDAGRGHLLLLLVASRSGTI